MKKAKTVNTPTPVTVEELAALTDFYQEQLIDAASAGASDPDNTPEWRAALLKDLDAKRAQYSRDNDCSSFHTRLAVLQYREAQKVAAL